MFLLLYQTHVNLAVIDCYEANDYSIIAIRQIAATNVYTWMECIQIVS